MLNKLVLVYNTMDVMCTMNGTAWIQELSARYTVLQVRALIECTGSDQRK